MARNPRCDDVGSWHHVLNRGIARRSLFESREDIRSFLACLARAVRRGQLEVHAWCVLTTHYHRLVRSPAGELSAAMRRVQNDYVRRFNRGRKRDGPWVRGRFVSKPVDLVAPLDAAATRARPDDRFTPLIQTRLEVQTPGALFEERFDEKPVLLTKKDATKAAMHASAPSELHLATHGWFAPESVPSQAGERSAGELAVLSACETNVGLRRAGQGIQSLQSALYAAGARTSITSLGRVDDALTRRLMELFDSNLWLEEMPKAKALWEAKRALRDDGAPGGRLGRLGD